MTKELDRKRILELSEELRMQRARAQVYIVGGGPRPSLSERVLDVDHVITQASPLPGCSGGTRLVVSFP